MMPQSATTISVRHPTWTTIQPAEGLHWYGASPQGVHLPALLAAGGVTTELPDNLR